MKMKTRLLAMAAGLAISASAAPAAWALQTEFIATGTVADGTDATGVFGAAGADLSGDAFTADFYIDTSKGTAYINTAISDFVQGGVYFTTLSPVYATLTINKTTQSFSGNEQGEADVSGQGDVNQEQVSGYVDDTDHNGNFLGQFEVALVDGEQDEPFPTVLGQAFSVSPSDGSNVSGGGFFELVNSSSGDYTAYGDLLVTNISSPGVISAAPEPSAWALLVAGVGLSGLALRRGRRRGWATA